MRKLALIVLDGWGVGKNDKSNAIYTANTPFFKRIVSEFPYTQLQASHEYVGLPHGQLGGSEVGHLTIGAGRVFFQDLPRISRSFEEPTNPSYGILHNKSFLAFLEQAKQHPAHLIGMVSPGGIHSHQDHLFMLLALMKQHGCKSPYIHFISDGRDTLPRAGKEYAQLLLQKLSDLQYGKVVTVGGRFYIMDRDKNWDRTDKGVAVITEAKAEVVQPGLAEAFDAAYTQELTDELQLPTLLDASYTGIKPNEPLFFFNYRADRMRQPVSKIHDFSPENSIYTLTQYDERFSFPVIFEKQQVTETLGEVISKQGIAQLRAAETDKIPHVSYFFDGGVELKLPQVHTVYVESTKVTYDQTPEMRAKEIVDGVIATIDAHPVIGFALVNIANADLVGHFGKYDPIIKACEVTDTQLERLCAYFTEKDYVCIVTSDHGHADLVIDEATGQTMTAHSLNPVPFVIYCPRNPELKTLTLDQAPDNGLSKVAGTVLDIMEIEKPTHDYESLITKE